MRLRTRREFLRATRNLGLAAAASTALPRIALGDAMGLPPAIQLYTVREDLTKDTPGTLKTLYEVGFRQVETAGFGKYSAKEFRKLLDDVGLKVPSAHVNLNAADLSPVFEDVHALGAHYATSSILLPTELSRPVGGKGFVLPAMGLAEFRKLADLMNEIGTRAKASTLQYAYHNHNHEFVKMPDGSYGYDVLLNNTDPDLVKFEVDCGWMSAAGADPIAYFRKYPGRFKMIHVKEFQSLEHPVTTLTGPERPKGTDLGQGFIDYKAIFAAGRKAGIEHAFSEQEAPFPVSQMASAKVAYAFLHSSS